MAKSKKKRKGKRTEEGGLPPGFQRVEPDPGAAFEKPTRETRASLLTRQRIAYNQMSQVLYASAQICDNGKIKCHVRVVANKDFTVDGELRFSNIRRGYTTTHFLLDFEEYFEQIPRGFYFSIGGLFTERSEKNVQDEIAKHVRAGVDPFEATRIEKRKYARYKGLDRISIYNRVAEIKRKDEKPIDNTPYAFQAAREMFKRLKQKKWRGKPEQILIRLFWTPDQTRPKKN